MDVKKHLLLGALALIIANCNQNHSPSSESLPKFSKASSSECSRNSLQGEYLVYWKNGEITVERSESDESFINDFVENHKDEILTSEPHYKLMFDDSVKLVERSWGGYPNWGVDSIGAENLWPDVDPQSQIVVAVVDSGVDIQHPELADMIYVNEAEEMNGKDDDGNGLVDDRHGYDFVKGSGEIRDYTGHGTHVAGIIGADHSVGKIKGVASRVKILPLAFISDTGGGSVQSAIDSLRYAASKKVQVINASWGGDGCSTVLAAEIKALAAQNILFVTAAGNSGNNLSDSPEYPAAFRIDNMLTVGASALDDSGQGQVMAIFSNFGELVDLMAPGAAITSTFPPEKDTEDDSFDGLATLNGTSMATPHVAGAAALLWSIKPGASYLEIKQALLKGVQPGPFRVKTRGSLYLPDALQFMSL